MISLFRKPAVRAVRVGRTLMAALILGLLSVAGASAQTHTWDFSFAGNNNPGTVGNVRTFTSNLGMKVQVSSFSVTRGSSQDASFANPLIQSFLGQYDRGLGVNPSGDDFHTVDNSRRIDIVVFQFETMVRASSISLSAFGDTDFDYWTGSRPAGFDFTNTKMADFTSIFGMKSGSSEGGSSDRTLTLSELESVIGNVLIIAADTQTGDKDDRFKIKKVKAVPSPLAGAGLPAIAGLATFWFWRRRRAQPATGCAARA